MIFSLMCCCVSCSLLFISHETYKLLYLFMVLVLRLTCLILFMQISGYLLNSRDNMIEKSIFFIRRWSMFYPLTHKDAQHREFENTNFRHNQQTQYTTGYSCSLGKWSEGDEDKAQWWALTTVTGHATLLTTWLLTLPIIILLHKRNKTCHYMCKPSLRCWGIEERGGIFFFIPLKATKAAITDDNTWERDMFSSFT